MALKLDMSNAYDRVEWGSIITITTQLDFNQRWINIIMGCLSSVSYSMVINGKTRDKFKLGKRLRQSNPLSPLLFLVYG